MVNIYKLFFLALLLSCNTAAYAETVGATPINPVISLLKMSVALTLVLGILWFCSRILKKFHAPNLQAKSGLKLVSTYNLGQREKLLVMQVGDEQLLLGVTSASISTLHVLPTPLDLPTSDTAVSFKKTLRAAMNREVSG